MCITALLCKPDAAPLAATTSAAACDYYQAAPCRSPRAILVVLTHAAPIASFACPCSNLVAIPDAAAAPGPLGASGASKDAARRIQSGLLDRLFSDNVMDLLLLLAQHSQQASGRVPTLLCWPLFEHASQQ